MLHRKLLIAERNLFREHLKRLSTVDRSFRFAHARVGDDWIDKYVNGIAADDLLLGCFDGGCLVGAAHVAFSGEVAELGISVDPQWRTKGVGAELTRRAVRWARNRRAGKLYTLCQSDNMSMIALARKLGMTIHRESGTAEAFLALPPPDLITVGDELGAEFDGLAHDWLGMVRACQQALLPKD